MTGGETHVIKRKVYEVLALEGLGKQPTIQTSQTVMRICIKGGVCQARDRYGGEGGGLGKAVNT